MQSYAYDNNLPCKNPNCKSGGRPHPNCHCYAMGGSVDQCTGMHTPDCEYFLDGGAVADPEMVANHAAVEHGLHGMVADAGRHKEPGMGVHDLHADARKGHKRIKSAAKDFFEPGMPEEEDDTDKLHGMLDALNGNPMGMADMGGDVGVTHPEHAAALAATASTAVQYLNSIKPQPIQVAPLDPVIPPDKMEMRAYNRQVQIAQHPLSVVRRAKDGTILPQDVTTLNIIYPRLAQSMRDAVMEELVRVKTDGKVLSYRQKQGLSALLGQPLDSTLTPSAAQAVMAAQGPQQAMQQAKAGPGASKPTSADLDAIEKDDTLSETPQEARLAKRKE